MLEPDQEALNAFCENIYEPAKRIILFAVRGNIFKPESTPNAEPRLVRFVGPAVADASDVDIAYVNNST